MIPEKYEITFVNNKTKETKTEEANGIDITDAINNVKRKHAYMIKVTSANLKTTQL